jgi:hypothetical protein
MGGPSAHEPPAGSLRSTSRQCSPMNIAVNGVTPTVYPSREHEDAITNNPRRRRAIVGRRHFESVMQRAPADRQANSNETMYEAYVVMRVTLMRRELRGQLERAASMAGIWRVSAFTAPWLDANKRFRDPEDESWLRTTRVHRLHDLLRSSSRAILVLRNGLPLDSGRCWQQR